ncbi:unnamed protein product [Toxocara canis]|uniref:Secreted protein n=1 Tax=Toxocara canis TaxID=6265 RepID=A0A183VA26_TOXCA|nr:unnamed protein product [Toxocara canis]
MFAVAAVLLLLLLLQCAAYKDLPTDLSFGKNPISPPHPDEFSKVRWLFTLFRDTNFKEEFCESGEMRVCEFICTRRTFVPLPFASWPSVPECVHH